MSRSFTRRDFLSGSLGVGAAGALHTALGPVPSLARSGSGAKAPTAATAGKGAASKSHKSTPERTLVLCTLYGGNDGLNTVVPYESSAYRSLRGGVAIGEDQAQPIGTVDNFKLGLHPALVGMKGLWDAGQVAIVLGVGYPNPNYSHFQSMEIMMSADPTGDLPSGWIGRWLDASGASPTRALSVGSQLPQVFAGMSQQGSTLADSTNPGTQQPDGDPYFISSFSECEHTYHREPGLQAAIAQTGTDLLVVGAKAASALTSQKPPNAVSPNDPGDIGNQLDVVAELIKAGLPTKAYGVSESSFDTHAGELEAQAELLSQLDAGVTNFMGAFPSGYRGLSPVIVMFSEFGRRPESNASGGTDHGSANIVIVVGPSVKGGFYGDMQSLTRLDDLGNFRYTTDIRRVYATVLAEIMGVDPKDFVGPFAPLGFLG
ncbi:MAG: DUF1501 domain-containing protein [Acidimicrobiales bacterium]|jgi:uncharacterized protein (DUF1501 family)